MPERNVLPCDPKPSHYDLSIVPNFDTFEFKGVVGISIHAEKPCTKIVLNYNDLTFSSAVVTCDGKEQTIQGSDITLDEPNMRASIPLGNAIQGEAVVTITYAGNMNDQMVGFYRSKYTVDGKEAYMGTTQFEAVDARRALPCWDEPVYKATFTLTLTVDQSLMALSNMPEASSTNIENNMKVVKFEKSPVMSTYLLAWTIGVLEVIEMTIDKVHGGGTTLVRVFTPEGKIEQGRFALDVAAKVLPLYENFFGSNYILPKVDLLAIPDFAAGAMENWGLITYRETALLCDDKSSAAHREWVAIVVAHELAHQWFGNLVTMEWWKELWLNEAFATWVEYWAVDTLFPEWEIWTTFVNSDTNRALTLDALTSSHPVEVDVVNAQEIDDIFDAISYSKGGSILRMAIEFIKIDAFRDGIREYLKHFEFKNATTVDLWDFLGKAAGKDLTGILASWTGKIGYPMLTVDKATDASITVTQNRFLSNGPAPEEQDQTLWQIPLNVLCAGDKEYTSSVITERTNTIGVTKADWIKVNANQGAFVRVKYSEKMLSELAAAISAGALASPIDRLSIVGDYHAFSQGGFVSTADALKLLSSFQHERDAIVWAAVAEFEADVKSILVNEDKASKDAFNQYAAKIYGPTMECIGFAPKDGDNHRTAQMRATLFSRLASAEAPEVISACRKMFAERATTEIPADLRGIVYRTEVSKGGREAFNTIKAMYEAEKDAMECVRLLRALSAASDTELIQEAIDYSLSEKVRPQDAMYGIVGLISTPAGAEAYFTMITTRFEELIKKFPGMLFGRIVKAVENFTTESRAVELEKFWETVPEGPRMAAERSFRQGVEGLRTKAAWATRDAKAIVEHVKSIQ